MPKKPAALVVLDLLSLILVPVVMLIIIVYTPVEVVMGPVQKVFYFHISAAWAGMVCFILGAVGGAGYLLKRRIRWDWLSSAAIEVGLVFSIITIFSGMIWARPIWNTWWVWDPRLTTTAIMTLIYLAYFILRAGVSTPEAQARLGAVFAILAALTVPLTFFSIRLFRTIHPVVIAPADGAGGAFSMSPRMLNTLLISLLVFTVLLVDLVWRRVRLAQLEFEMTREVE